MTESRVALVTGASSGIGEATARRLHEEGYVVYAGARRVQRMATLAEAGIVTTALDVTDDASMVGLVERIIAEQGRIDLLVNNAGYGAYGSVEEVPMDEARAQMEVNVFGLARLCQLVMPHMRAVGRGRIVNVSSMGGRFGEGLGAWYHASKFAVEGFSDSLRLEAKEFGVDVIVIQPGAIATEWGEAPLASAEKFSGDGPYAGQVRRMRNMYSGAFRIAAQPKVIADAIWTAVTARSPRPRYAAPFAAKLTVLAADVLPDRALDAVMLRAMRRFD